MLDLLIVNGLIADGSGGPLYAGTLAVRGGEILAVGNVAGRAARVIEAKGQIVAPGFIDIHSHTDLGLILDPSAQSKITQGITTEICGNCGNSAAPYLDRASRAELAKWRQDHDIPDDWTSLDQFFAVMESRPIAVNFATFVGHSNVRSAVVGLKERRAKTDELTAMRSLVAQAMREGAFGLSSGLIYAPSCYADASELSELAAGAAACGGIYASHIRNERDALIEAIAEAIEIGARSGAPVQISHHKACGRDNWGKVRQSLHMIDEAAAVGQDVTVDQYPYVAGSTSLSILLPRWAHNGGRFETLERLQSADRSRIEEEIEHMASSGWIANDGGWKSVVISGVINQRNKPLEGKDILQLAKLRGKQPSEALVDLLIEEELCVGMVHFAQCEEDVRTVMSHPAAMIGTDASARALTGPLSNGKPHPRAYGTFPRVLGKYVREEKVLDLPTAISKMTSRPARKLGIADRGRLAPGCRADIVVFDPDEISDSATYSQPHRVSRGVSYVLVNGEVAVEQGELTGVLAGRVLRSHRNPPLSPPGKGGRE